MSQLGLKGFMFTQAVAEHPAASPPPPHSLRHLFQLQLSFEKKIFQKS